MIDLLMTGPCEACGRGGSELLPPGRLVICCGRPLRMTPIVVDDAGMAYCPTGTYPVGSLIAGEPIHADRGDGTHHVIYPFTLRPPAGP